MRLPIFGRSRRLEEEMERLRGEVERLQSNLQRLPAEVEKRIRRTEEEVREAVSRVQRDGVEALRDIVEERLGDLSAKVAELFERVEEPPKVRDYKARVLKRMLKQGVMGGKHVPMEALLGGIPKEDRKEAERALDELVRKQFVARKPHQGGKGVTTYTLNRDLLEEIRRMAGE